MSLKKKKPQSSGHLASVLERNIATLVEVRRQMDRRRRWEDRLADGITSFSGSAIFVALHIVWFSLWMMWNIGWFGTIVFDPFPFGLLTLIVSLEAIFLSAFILISQNRMSSIADQRADLDLQINLLAEYEITRLLKLTDAIAQHLGIQQYHSHELEELKRDINPEAILKEMEGKKHLATWPLRR